METLQAINGELQTSDRAGIVMNFEKVNERINSRPELANGAAADQKWHKTQQIVYVRTKYTTGSFLGFWPIPESYFPDPDAEKLPARSAQPVLKFSTRDVKFRVSKLHSYWNAYFHSSASQTSLLTNSNFKKDLLWTPCWAEIGRTARGKYLLKTLDPFRAWTGPLDTSNPTLQTKWFTFFFTRMIMKPPWPWLTSFSNPRWTQVQCGKRNGQHIYEKFHDTTYLTCGNLKTKFIYSIIHNLFIWSRYIILK